MWMRQEKRGSTILFKHFNNAIMLLSTLEKNESTDESLRAVCKDIRAKVEQAKKAIPVFLCNARNRGPITQIEIRNALEQANEIIQSYDEKINAPYSGLAQCKELLIVNVPLTLLALTFLIPVILFMHFTIAIFLTLLVILPAYVQVNQEIIKDFKEGREVSPFEKISKELLKLESMFQSSEIHFDKREDPSDPYTGIFSEAAAADVGL